MTGRRLSIAFQTDLPLSAHGHLAAAAERHGFDVVSVRLTGVGVICATA